AGPSSGPAVQEPGFGPRCLEARESGVRSAPEFVKHGGSRARAPTRQCEVVDSGHIRLRDLALEVPSSPLEAVMSHEVWEQVYARLAALANEHRTTLIFVNTRRMAERA